MRAPHLRLSQFVAACLVAVLPSVAAAGPTLGFFEDFVGGSTGGFGGNAILSNPGTGGVGGAQDGFLMIEDNPINNHLGAKNEGADYAGDYLAAGITRVLFWLNDVGADQELEIHLCIGDASNLWQSQGFAPPENAWALFEVELSDSTSFTQVRSTPPGLSFAGALQNADRLLWRHDLAPYGPMPDPVDGEVGLDSIIFTAPVGGVDSPFAVPSSGARLLPAAPNPTRAQTVVTALLSERRAVSVRVYSPLGRLVRTLHRGTLPAGTHSFGWDGRDHGGAQVGIGVYYIRLVAGGAAQSSRVVIVR